MSTLFSAVVSASTSSGFTSTKKKTMFKSRILHLIFSILALTVMAWAIMDIADGSTIGDRTKTFMRWLSAFVFAILSIDHFFRWLNWKKVKKN